MARAYRDFSTLILHTQKGIDYDLTVVERGGEITVAAIHGGGIEPLTGELAEAIAGDKHNFYVFQGLCSREIDALRIPASRYDEMRLRALLDRGQAALSLEGTDDEAEIVGVGGQNRRLRGIMRETLEAAGWDAGKLSGVMAPHDPALFFNRPERGGVQLELSRGVRAAMIDGPLTDFSWESEARWNEHFHTFVDVVRASLERYLVELNADLDRTMDRFERTTDAFPPSMRDADHQHEE